MGSFPIDYSFKIEKSKDFDLIKKIIFHPDIKPTLLPIEDEDKLNKLLSDDNKTYYVIYQNGLLMGIVIFLNFTNHKNGADIFFSDIGIFKPFRGKYALEAASLCLDIFFSENDVLRFMCVVKSDHSGCICFCKKLGFKVIEYDSGYFLLEVERNGWNS